MGFVVEEEKMSSSNGIALALVVSERNGPFKLQAVTLKDMRPDEIIVHMVATGVCHTDFAASDGMIPVPFPIVLGHEGAGVVERVGSEVHHLAAGDHVLLTFPHCGACTPCIRNRPSYCLHNGRMSFGGSRLDGSKTFATTDREPADVHSAYFAQSSFASRSIVRASSAVRVDPELPLHTLAPLGCGIQTGAGTVLNVLKPTPGSSVVVYGVGGVGLAGVMAAAKLTPAATIIAVDVVDAKLDMARELGATHTINSRGKDVVQEVKALTGGEGADFAMDATGRIEVVQAMLDAAANCAVVATVGGPALGETVKIEPAMWLQRGVSYVGACQGSSVPQVFLPALVQYWKQGRFPIDKLITKYKYSEMEKARQDMHHGKCIKPVLVWSE